MKYVRAITTLALTLLLLFAYTAGLAPLRSVETAAQAKKDEDNQEGRHDKSKTSSGLRERQRRGDGDKIEVILQHEGRISGPLNAFLNRNGVHARQEFRNLDSLNVELPASSLEELASYSEVRFISPRGHILLQHRPPAR
ncbi:MAG TPA: hypothetical protein VGX92_15940 [Pyrinomonadaceae bacterium]|jgi:hypothetical protein|nr:hypothetical protein [Pyrinomonadaceae bacterium]